MTSAADLHAEPATELPPLASFAFARPRRRNRVIPWLLLVVVWSLATALLIFGTETAALIASAAP